MYCPHCGSESQTGLKFCKHCGGNLIATSPLEAKRASSGSLSGQAWAVALATVAVCLGGLGIVFTNALDIMSPSPWGGSKGEPTLVAALMIAFGSATVFGIAAMLIRLFMRITGIQGRDSSSDVRRSASSSYRPAQLPEPSPVVGSVTEHTTRNFDKTFYEGSR
ncbi:MAG TPA: zinc ribbon domain-containing protein [Blastocatellia bacterium]|nr:zinc ribbon domain-containing protein [Blastocatellia bacterium]